MQWLVVHLVAVAVLAGERITEFGELPDGRNYFVMEWLDGEPLTSRIDRGAVDGAGAPA